MYIYIFFKVAHFALINVSVFIKLEIGLGENPARKSVTYVEITGNIMNMQSDAVEERREN